MTGHHHAGVPLRAIISFFLLSFPDADAQAPLQCIVGGAEADDSSTDDDNVSIFFVAHVVAENLHDFMLRASELERFCEIDDSARGADFLTDQRCGME